VPQVQPVANLELRIRNWEGNSYPQIAIVTFLRRFDTILASVWSSPLKILEMHIVMVSALWIMGAFAPFTDRGITDFDTFLQILNPYGQWKQEDGQWRYFPLSAKPFVPMTSGVWLYTDYGWYWQGSEPFTWACDHYGVWKLGKSGTWGWMPDQYWHPFKVDFRMTKTHIGWRPSAINQMGFVEKEEERFAKPEEWVFVTKEKFRGPITPADVITGSQAAKLLEDSSPCDHVYVSYREMDRLGPDPVNFLPKERVRDRDDLKDGESEVIAPVLWSLPTFWSAPPLDAKAGDLYVYRPKLYQDKDGIQRRTLIWNHPEEQVKAKENLNQVLQGK